VLTGFHTSPGPDVLEGPPVLEWIKLTEPRIRAARRSDVDSPYAWVRLAASVALGTIGGVGLWSMPVVMSSVQAEFGVLRADASLPFTLTMLGFACGGVAMGRLQDRFGILAPALLGIGALSLGFFAASISPTLWTFALSYLLIGVGGSATFGPIMTDVSFWFAAHRGIAVGIAAAGNYLAGTIWPPVIQHAVATAGWRQAHAGAALVCLALMLPLLLLLRRPAPRNNPAQAATARSGKLDVSPGVLQVLLCIAGLACCVAMAMPQVHIVAYCGDLGYGVARGAEMLSLMMGFGIVSRIGSGFIADRIGGLATLLLGSAAQGLALLLYAMFDGMASLYVISALFGLFQGGIVPSYAFVIREYFPPSEVGTRLGVVLMMTLFGMALGGWMSGAVFDYFGSYQAAFLNGLAWNLLNLVIALTLMTRSLRQQEALA
jgi:MFS family permease